MTQAAPLLVDVDATAVIGDKGYDADEMITTIRAQGAQAVIPSRSNRRHGRRLDRRRYRKRNLIERFFCRLKHFRRIATRYEKLAQRYSSSFVALTAAVIWLGGLS